MKLLREEDPEEDGGKKEREGQESARCSQRGTVVLKQSPTDALSKAS